jgi:hypothetical protein
VRVLCGETYKKQAYAYLKIHVFHYSGLHTEFKPFFCKRELSYLIIVEYETQFIKASMIFFSLYMYHI